MFAGDSFNFIKCKRTKNFLFCFVHEIYYQGSIKSCLGCVSIIHNISELARIQFNRLWNSTSLYQGIFYKNRVLSSHLSSRLSPFFFVFLFFRSRDKIINRDKNIFQYRNVFFYSVTCLNFKLLLPGRMGLYQRYIQD